MYECLSCWLYTLFGHKMLHRGGQYLDTQASPVGKCSRNTIWVTSKMWFEKVVIN